MHEDLEVEPENVVTDDDVRVQLLDAGQEQAQQLALRARFLDLHSSNEKKTRRNL